MRWVTAASEAPETATAVREVVAAIGRALGADPHLLIVFASTHHGAAVRELAGALRDAFPHAAMIGCTAAGVIGGGRELEDDPALSVTAAVLPDVGLRAFHLPGELVERDEPLDGDAVAAAIEVSPDLRPSFLLLPEPWSCDTEALLAVLDARWPGATKVGGLPSGARQPGDHALFIDGRVVREGLVGVALWGDVVMDAVVAQGCRPIGPALTVTEAQGQVVSRLDDRPAVEVLQRLYDQLDDATRALFQASPMVGIATPGDGATPRQGDWLIRHVVGLDRQRGAIGIGQPLATGDVVRFHVRDARASADDLRELLQRDARLHPDPPVGALLFSCLGRGGRFYGEPDHDSGLVRGEHADLPIGGFFCGGEIGPVRARTWLHGYTSALALFRRPAWN